MKSFHSIKMNDESERFIQLMEMGYSFRYVSSLTLIQLKYWKEIMKQAIPPFVSEMNKSMNNWFMNEEGRNKLSGMLRYRHFHSETQ